MKSIFLFFIFSIALSGYNNVYSQSAGMDWTSIKGKCLDVKYVFVHHDSTSKENIFNRVRTYDANAKLLSREQVELLLELMSNPVYHSTEQPQQVCTTFYFPYSFLVYKGDIIQGTMKVGCDGRLLVVDPLYNHKELFVLNEKGLELKNKILNFGELAPNTSVSH